MDSNQKTELQTNELEKLLQNANQFLEKHGNRISIAVCVITALIVGGILYRRQSSAKEQFVWDKLAFANSPDDLSDVWNESPDTLAGIWARLMEAEQRYAVGVQSMFSDYEVGKGDVDRARINFKKLSELSKAPAEVQERALFGFARAEETLAEGDVKAASTAYGDFLKKYPNSFFASDAKKRVAALKQGGAAEFSEWFAKYERPKTKDRTPKDHGIDDSPLGDLLREQARQIGEKARAEKESNDDDLDEVAEPKKKKGLTLPDDTEEGSGETPDDSEKPVTKPENPSEDSTEDEGEATADVTPEPEAKEPTAEPQAQPTEPATPADTEETSPPAPKEADTKTPDGPVEKGPDDKSEA